MRCKRAPKELTESLEQQTATSEVLQVISSSPGELEPVFNKMLENATRVCNAEFGTMLLREHDAFRHVALYNVPPALGELVARDPIVHSPQDGVLGRVARTKESIRVDDLRDEPVYLRGIESARLLADAGGARSVLGVPMHQTLTPIRTSKSNFHVPPPPLGARLEPLRAQRFQCFL
jgi:hypothetical protein